MIKEIPKRANKRQHNGRINGVKAVGIMQLNDVQKRKKRAAKNNKVTSMLFNKQAS